MFANAKCWPLSLRDSKLLKVRAKEKEKKKADLEVSTALYFYSFCTVCPVFRRDSSVYTMFFTFFSELLNSDEVFMAPRWDAPFFRSQWLFSLS
jgi:hypothetical protein